MIRIVIADDHTLMREGLKRILEGDDEITVVGEAIDGFSVLEQVRKGGFDLLLIGSFHARTQRNRPDPPNPDGSPLLAHSGADHV